MLKLKTILHPTDFSDQAKAAFHLASSLARDHGARIVVLHVIPQPLMSTDVAVANESPALREMLLRELQQTHPSDGKFRLDYRLVEGDPADAVLDVAAASKCDLIVMGTHGRTGLWRAVMGSVAEQVSREATCPVLTMKRPIKDADQEREAGKDS